MHIGRIVPDHGTYLVQGELRRQFAVLLVIEFAGGYEAVVHITMDSE